MNYKQEWKRLYSWARKSKSVNPNMQKDMLSGFIKPCRMLTEMLDQIGF
jgi:hypothetical protein